MRACMQTQCQEPFSTLMPKTYSRLARSFSMALLSSESLACEHPEDRPRSQTWMSHQGVRNDVPPYLLPLPQGPTSLPRPYMTRI